MDYAIVQEVQPGLLGALAPQYQEKKEKESIQHYLRKRGFLCEVHQIKRKEMLVEGVLQKGYVVENSPYAFIIEFDDKQEKKLGEQSFRLKAINWE
ncbi:MAG: hypothetical protein ACOVOR_01355 [Rhabdochlamydiaceae bacterium]